MTTKRKENDLFSTMRAIQETDNLTANVSCLLIPQNRVMHRYYSEAEEVERNLKISLHIGEDENRNEHIGTTDDSISEDKQVDNKQDSYFKRALDYFRRALNYVIKPINASINVNWQSKKATKKEEHIIICPNYDMDNNLIDADKHDM